MSKADLPPNNGEFFSGDSKRIVFNVSGVALTGYTVLFVLFKGRERVLEKTNSNGLTVAENSFSVDFDPADTAALKGSYTYEARGTGPNGEVVTLAYGTLKIIADKI